MTPSPSRAVRMLTDEEIDAIAAHEYRAKRLPWLGFKKDAEGRYTLPYVTDAERALIRAVVATLSQETAAPAAPFAKESWQHAVDDQLRRVTQALGDLSFECFGGIGTAAPSVETYNRTFEVLEEVRAFMSIGEQV